MNKNTKLKQGLYFLPLGGSNEIGMNVNLYCCDDQWILVDFGITFERSLGIDVVLPDPGFIKELKNKLQAVFVTHAHEDHIGALPYFWEDFSCPVYASPFAATVIKGKLDQRRGIADTSKIKEVTLGESISVPGFTIEYISVTHSIPESCSLYIKTKYGSIVHTGDWKLDSTPLVGEDYDEKRFREIGKEGVLALVCDSTNIFEEGHTETEMKVKDSLEKICKSEKNRIFLTCFSSNISRLFIGAQIAKKCGREVVLFGTSLEKMHKYSQQHGYLNLPKVTSRKNFAKLPKNKVLVICTGSQAEERAALSKLCYGVSRDVFIDAQDVVIFSSRVIPGNEDAISKLKMALLTKGVRIISSEHDEENMVHVSGHPSQEDLRSMYNWVKPELLIPVHGEKLHLQEHKKFALDNGIKHSIVPENGRVLSLKKGEKPQFVKHVSHGRLAVDGHKIVPINSDHIKQRAILMESGSLSLTLVLGKERKIINPPQMTFQGITSSEHHIKLREEILLVIEQTLFSTRSYKKMSMVKNDLEKNIRSHINKSLGFPPLISIHILQVRI